MGRPAEYTDKVRTTLDIERPLLERVDAEAERRDLSRARVLHIVIERGLGLLVPLPGDDDTENGDTDGTA